jgi:multisubunit Na+/H+ antiporter MnhF subunit
VTKRLVDVALGLILLTIIATVAISAVQPYLPIIGIGIVVVVLLATAWFTYRLINRRQAP